MDLLNLMFATYVARVHEFCSPKQATILWILGSCHNLWVIMQFSEKLQMDNCKICTEMGSYTSSQSTPNSSLALSVSTWDLFITRLARTGSRLIACTESARTSARSLLLGPPSEPVRVREVHDNSDIADAAFPATPTRDSPEIGIDDLHLPRLN